MCSHSDVLNDSVLYIQDDLEATSDGLEFDIYDIENTLRRQRAEIVVKARLDRRQSRLQVTDQQPVVIGLDLLDASRLKVTKLIDVINVFYVVYSCQIPIYVFNVLMYFLNVYLLFFKLLLKFENSTKNVMKHF